MEIQDLFEYTVFNLNLDEIKEEYKNLNYVKSADLCNKMLIKYLWDTNINIEIKEVLYYKRLSDFAIWDLCIKSN